MRFLLTILIFTTACMAHSWVERLMLFDQEGNMIGNPGYIRGAVSRYKPGFNDLQMQYILPHIGTSALSVDDRICKETQTWGNYSKELPPLTAYAGAFIALQYQENGHVTLPQNSPQKKNGGMVYIYGTSKPHDDDKFAEIHGVWNKDGTGGDRRGRLLASQAFDDGQCYQINTGPISQYRQTKYPKPAMDPQGADLWCQNDIRLPRDIKDTYSLYWVWDWPSSVPGPPESSTPEIYTSCMDISLRERVQGEGSYTGAKGKQDLNFAGIYNQLAAALLDV